jgi:hypothetical protein
MHRLLALVFVAALAVLGCTQPRHTDAGPCISQCGLNQAVCQRGCGVNGTDKCQGGCADGYKECVKACANE